MEHYFLHELKACKIIKKPSHIVGYNKKTDKITQYTVRGESHFMKNDMRKTFFVNYGSFWSPFSQVFRIADGFKIALFISQMIEKHLGLKGYKIE